ncbi:MAG: flagellar hook assembly protein FlgD [Lautropia sp.]
MNSTTGVLSWPSAAQSTLKQATGDRLATATASGSAGSTDAGKVIVGGSAAGLFDSVNTDSASQPEAGSADGTEDRFLKLLVAQMRNQDPLNPMENAEVTTQLAQISTVRGVESLNRTMESFVNQNTAVSAVGMLGRQVLVQGSKMNYTPPAAGGTTRIGFELDAAATAARIDVVDAAGRVVFSKSMSDLQKGMQTIDWDGKDTNGATVPAGPLSVQVLAVDGTATIGAEPLVPARVLGVTQTSEGVRLELEGADPVLAADVRSIS